MNIAKAVKIAQQILDATSDREVLANEALGVLIDLGKKVTTRTPSQKKVPGMAVCELVRALLKAKDQKAPINITDTEGSFSDDQIITVDEDQDGGQVNIVVQYVEL